MSSLKRHEGYLFIDHRASPGITAEFIRSCGKNPADFLIVGEGKMVEAATYTCSHCQKVVVIKPDRTRARGYCPKCDRQVCDACEALRFLSGGECNLFRKRVEVAQEEAFLREQRGGTILSR